MEWLKRILGSAYSEEAAKQAAAEIGKRFVSREDFNSVNEAKKTLARESAAHKEVLARLQEQEAALEALKREYGDLQQVRAEDKEAFARTLRETQVSHALQKAGTKNETAARALLEAFLANAESQNGSVTGLDEEIARLQEAEDSSFLFEQAALTITGAAPAQSEVSAPDPERSSMEAKLAQARNEMDTLAAIRIKQEAAREGIVLI